MHSGMMMMMMATITGTLSQLPASKNDRSDTATIANWRLMDQLSTSPALTLTELFDLIETERELREGQGKRFASSRSLFEDLDSSD